MIKRTLCIGIAAAITACLAPCQQITADETPEREAQRIFGIVPNYRTSPSIQDSEPLTIGEKFKVASEDSFDRGTVALSAIFAGQSQLTNANRSFGQGGAGYGRYFGAAYGDFVIAHYMTEAVFPTLLHQDPRYFRCGTGSGWSRLGYAMRQIFWAHRDSGGTQFNYSEIVGNSVAVASRTHLCRQSDCQQRRVEDGHADRRRHGGQYPEGVLAGVRAQAPVETPS